MTPALVILAVVAALRGTWSPCGLSMLSTITPVATRARGHSFARAAAAYVAGATVGGAVLGGYMGLLSWLTRRTPLPTDLRVGIAFAIAAVCLAADARLGGLRLPDHPRQVDETWVDRYRPWAYAGGFGVQIGSGLCTYVMTNAVYTITLAGAVLLAPRTALLVGVAFGATRGATILFGSVVTSPGRLRSFHRLLERTAVPSLAVTMLAQVALLATCLAVLRSGVLVAMGVACACVLCVAAVANLASRSRRELLLTR